MTTETAKDWAELLCLPPDKPAEYNVEYGGESFPRRVRIVVESDGTHVDSCSFNLKLFNRPASEVTVSFGARDISTCIKWGVNMKLHVNIFQPGDGTGFVATPIRKPVAFLRYLRGQATGVDTQGVGVEVGGVTITLLQTRSVHGEYSNESVIELPAKQEITANLTVITGREIPVPKPGEGSDQYVPRFGEFLAAEVKDIYQALHVLQSDALAFRPAPRR